jgi:hypothetical protein
MSHYEINVSLNGHHLFATAERNITTGIPQPLEDLLKKTCPLRQPLLLSQR